MEMHEMTVEDNMKVEMRFISTFISNDWLTVKLTVTNSYLTMYIKKMTTVYKNGFESRWSPENCSG